MFEGLMSTRHMRPSHITYSYTHMNPTGDFDTCEEKASALYMCLSNKIKKDPKIQEASASESSCVYSFYVHKQPPSSN